MGNLMTLPPSLPKKSAVNEPLSERREAYK